MDSTRFLNTHRLRRRRVYHNKCNIPHFYIRLIENLRNIDRKPQFNYNVIRLSNIKEVI